jgi:hypothetical protein
MRTYTLRVIVSFFELLESDAASAGSRGQQAGAAAGARPQQQQAEVLPSATLLQVQATLLMHISTMLKYDALLGAEWLKWLGKDSGAMMTKQFMLQVCVCVTRRWAKACRVGATGQGPGCLLLALHAQRQPGMLLLPRP